MDIKRLIWIEVLVCLMVIAGCQAKTAAQTGFGSEPITAENSSDLEVLATLEGHTGIITSVVFSNDGAYIASSGRDRAIKLWDAHSGEELHTFDAGTSELDINGIIFSPDSQWLITPLTAWNVETYDTALTLNRSGLHVAVSPDGRLLAINGAHQPVKIWDTASGEVISTIAGSGEDNTFSLTFSPDGTLLAGSCSYGFVKIWDVESGELVIELDYGDGSDVHDLAFTPDGSRLLTGGTAHSMRLWDTASWETIDSFSAEGVMGLAISPDGSLVAAVLEYSVKIWEIESGLVVASLRHNTQILSVAFSADGSLVAVGAYDGNIYLWGITP